MFNTIAAISTPHGKGGIAVIRISGDKTDDVLSRCFLSKTKPQDKPRHAVFGSVVKGDEIIDSGLCTFFEEGRSFTGEKSAEISCHGGTAVTRAVLEAVFSAGAVPAEAGEFTRRAFVNGKLTLTEAEAVGKLIDADTDSRRRLASDAARGKLTSKVEKIRASLTHILAALYAAIDYPDEDIGDEGEKNILSVITEAKFRLSSLLDSYKTGSAIVDGVVTSICGSPNSGKSTLYNLLCGDDKAIVTDIAGTTRDTLWETVDFGGITLRLADTAGIHDTSDTVESIGVSRAIDTMKNAELVIAVFDCSRTLSDEDLSLIERLKESDAFKIGVINKNDKGIVADVDVINNSCDKTVYMSAKDGVGLDELSSVISDVYNTDRLTANDEAIIWDARHKAIIENAVNLLSDAIDGLNEHGEIDAISTIVEKVLSEISLLDSREVTDEILAEIFSHFCVGK